VKRRSFFGMAVAGIVGLLSKDRTFRGRPLRSESDRLKMAASPFPPEGSYGWCTYNTNGNIKLSNIAWTQPKVFVSKT